MLNTKFNDVVRQYDVGCVADLKHKHILMECEGCMHWDFHITNVNILASNADLDNICCRKWSGRMLKGTYQLTMSLQHCIFSNYLMLSEYQEIKAQHTL